MKYQRSSALFKNAKKVIPGGVNSPVRAFKAVGGEPIFAQSAKSAYLFDEDGNRYIDFINSWGPMILGHAHPKVVDAIINKAQKGTSFGMPTEIETQIADLAVSMVPGIDKIRFVNSGTEACMSAIRLARGYTQRDKIIKFSGCYHGHSDAFLIQAGSGASTFGIPNSPGVTQGTAKDTLLANFNDLESVKSLISENPQSIAAIILEPVPGNMGCIPPDTYFLKNLRSLCDENGILLLFDEVMTGFRLAKGGSQEKFNVLADIVCFGKVIGGGMPVGAFAANNDIMNHLAPLGSVYQAGTLSGNPLAMAAGLATLKTIHENETFFDTLEEKSAYLYNGLKKIIQLHGKNIQLNRVGSMLSVHFCKEEVRDYETAKLGDNNTFKKFFHFMLEKGIYLPPSAYETWFVSNAISHQDIDDTLEGFEEFLRIL